MFAEEFAYAAKQAAAEAGFDLAGIAPVRKEDMPELGAFIEWVDAGRAGEMKYLESRTESGELRRTSATNAAPWVRSMIVCALKYSADKPYSVAANDPERGWISRYAWGIKDYHDALLPRLRQVEASIKQVAAAQNLQLETRSYVDTGPILERVYAKYAGIGWIGKNTCIIHQKMGSWLFLGVILTSLELPADTPAADRCGSCTRCIDACPTQAIVAPGKLDARLCIAYHHRKARQRAGRTEAADGAPHFWLRYLPGCLPVEQQIRQRAPDFPTGISTPGTAFPS